MAYKSNLMLTRFAPSPTGPLHLGHAFAALTAFDRARAAGGQMLLRIEDIDTARCHKAYEAAIFVDLHWLGLYWPEPVLRQSAQAAAYGAALARLAEMGVIYPCCCTRADIRAALCAPQEGAPLHGPDGIVYPGTCRGRRLPESGPQDGLRLDIAAAMRLSGTLSFAETGPDHHGTHHLDA
ncbi:MAG: glutamate--tRNA ligase family protein, partial [Paracoccaceae bacterium]|nr:glutamate--tRNA ligase family protein [Paracoccaceae bacterium]